MKRRAVTLNLSRPEADHLQALVLLHLEKMRKLAGDPGFSDIAAVFKRSLDIEEGIMAKMEKGARG